MGNYPERVLSLQSFQKQRMSYWELQKKEGSKQKGERPIKKAVVTQDGREEVFSAFWGHPPDKIPIFVCLG
jgi:hypothetical protein